jgi:hypothetical protein
MLNFFSLSYFSHHQIWLNPLVDDHHFGYITNNNKKKKTLFTSCEKTTQLCKRLETKLGLQNVMKILWPELA